MSLRKLRQLYPLEEARLTLSLANGFDGSRRNQKDEEIDDHQAMSEHAQEQNGPVNNVAHSHDGKGKTEDAETTIISSFDANEASNPKNLPLHRKWLIVIMISISCCCVTCASSMYTSTYDQIEPEFGISQEVAILGLSLFVIGLGLGPMISAPLSEVLFHLLGIMESNN